MLAQQEAKALRRPEVGVEHIVMGLVAEEAKKGGWLGTGVTIDSARAKAKEIGSSAEDRAASRIQRGVTARFTESDGSTCAGLDTSRDDTFIREEDETTFDDATRVSENFDPLSTHDSLHGAIAGETVVLRSTHSMLCSRVSWRMRPCSTA